ncbi:MAG: hypothetical protein MUO70_07290, partial [Euryarchaeota archaeon]|nr:hypothetical protein [Euryarchaeota archaeon]
LHKKESSQDSPPDNTSFNLSVGQDHSNPAYVMTHGISGVDWKHYKHPLPENVFNVDMKSWADVVLPLRKGSPT